MKTLKKSILWFVIGLAAFIFARILDANSASGDEIFGAGGFPALLGILIMAGAIIVPVVTPLLNGIRKSIGKGASKIINKDH
jgi:hypothetical protein